MGKGNNRIDIWILIPILMLIGLSFGVVYSASSSWSARMSGGDSMLLFRNHLIRAVAGVFMIFLFSRIDYRYLVKYRKYLMGLVLIFLLYLLIANVGATKGAVRWIRIGGMSFQPVDFVKYALIINLAYMLAHKKDYMWSLYYSYLPMLLYVIIVAGLVALQPNISSAVVIFIASMMMFFIGKVKVKHLAFTFLSVLPIGALYIISKSYAMNRITAFTGSANNDDASYQLSQAVIGFGNGSILGVGPGNSNQKEFFLPQSYDDFVFAIVGEEYGFIGTFAVIALFALFVYKGYKLSKNMQDDFGRYLAFGITTIIAMNAVINMMVATGVIPTTGVTLPFVSYGGTSIIFNSIAVGILLNISTFRNNPATVWEEFASSSDDEEDDE